MRRDDISLYLSRSNRARLEAIINDRNSKAKTIWRAKIVLATADGHGTNEIMRRTGMSKPAVWRWQERYIEEGVEGLSPSVNLYFCPSPPAGQEARWGK